MEIEFTDRYGGNPPSWLRGCFECEAMGVSPTPDESADDGWRFDRCADCGGSGRVSWWVTVARLPRWLARGPRFIVQTWNYPGPIGGQSRLRFLRTQLWATYGADLARLWR